MMIENEDFRSRPHIVMVVARGEAVRNFIYSDTLRCLSESARVTLLTVVDDDEILGPYEKYVDEVLYLEHYRENRLVTWFRYLLHMAHYEWLGSEAAKYHWAIRQDKANGTGGKWKFHALKSASRLLSRRRILEAMTEIERYLSVKYGPIADFVELFRELKPDLVFNCSHIHGPRADLPLRTAYHLEIPTAAFVFSWDNLTTRSRILVPYDDFMVWTNPIRDHLLRLYPRIRKDRVAVTGTPQFDFHFKSEFHLSKEVLCRRIGADPSRPLILYTTGRYQDFPDEHLILEEVIRYVRQLDLEPKPQLVVRTYLKGVSPAMQALARKENSDVIFPAVKWEKKWLVPLYEDISEYTSLLRHAVLGINPASTVSLELMMNDKPVINLGFEPPGADLPHFARFSRHVGYDHYRPVVESGAVMVARSLEDLRNMIHRGLSTPWVGSERRKQFIAQMFGETLDGKAGIRVAETLIRMARKG